MSFPAGVHTRTVSFGPAVQFESGDNLVFKVSITASVNLVWAATGTPMYALTEDTVWSDPGIGLTLTLPVTDQAGWLFNGQVVDVADGNQSHWYTATVSVIKGKYVAYTGQVGPFVLPTGTGTIDVDTLITDASIDGPVTVSVPDTWSDYITAAEAAAASAAASAAAAAASLSNFLHAVDNGDGTWTVDDTGVVDHGDGTFTVGS